MIAPAGAVRRPGVPSGRLIALLASTVGIGLTGDPILVCIWVTLCFLALRGEPFNTSAMQLNNLFVAYVMLYPPTASAFTSLQEYSVVLAFLLAVALYLRGLELKVVWLASRGLRLLVLAWVGWGLLAYLPVLLTWVISQPIGVREWSLFGIQADTTSLKVAGPMILAVVALLLPVGALRAPNEFHRFARWLIGVLGLVVLASAIQAAAGFQLVATSYTAEEGRLVGLTNADPNYFGRLLLLPTLLAIGWMMRRREPGELSSKWIPLVTIGALGSVLMTLSRTTYASAAVGILALAVLNLKQRRTLPIVGTVLAVAVLTAAMFNFAGRFSADTQRGSLDTLNGRLVLYADVLEILRENPWFGARPGGYVSALYDIEQVRTNRRFAIEDMQVNSPHNMVLAAAAEFGLPMGVVLLSALGFAGLCGARALRVAATLGAIPGSAALDAFAKVSIAGTCAYAVHGLTEVVPPENVFWLLGLAVATLNCARVGQRHLQSLAHTAPPRTAAS